MKRPQNVGGTAARLTAKGDRGAREKADDAPSSSARPSARQISPVRTTSLPPKRAGAGASAPTVPPAPVSKSAKQRLDDVPKGSRATKAVTDDSAKRESRPSADSAAPSVRTAARKRRRYERAEIKRFTRSARRRRRAWLIGTGVAVLVLAGAAVVPLSPLMAVRTIDIDGTQRLSASQVRTALAPELGTPLALVDESAIERNLAAFPLVRSFSTQVEPPGTLVVHILERTPLMVLTGAKGYRLVDQAGVVIQTTAERPSGYPLLTVPPGASKATAAGEFTATANVLAALPGSMLGQVSAVSATGSQDVTLRLASGKSVVWGGPQQSDLKAVVLAALLKGAPGASVYDVSAPDSPVTR